MNYNYTDSIIDVKYLPLINRVKSGQGVGTIGHMNIYIYIYKHVLYYDYIHYIISCVILYYDYIMAVGTVRAAASQASCRRAPGSACSCPAGRDTRAAADTYIYINIAYYIYLSTLSIYLSINQSIYLSIYISIYLSLSLYINKINIYIYIYI